MQRKSKLLNRVSALARKAAIALAISSAAFATPAAAGRGQIVDEGSGEGLAGVFVVAYWEGQANPGAEGRTVCYDFAITQTDREGYFALQNRSRHLNLQLGERQRHVDFYFQGYQWSMTNSVTKFRRMDAGKIFLRKYTGSIDDRLARLAMPQYAGCAGATDKSASLLALEAAKYQEAVSIAQTPEQKQQVQLMREAFDEGWRTGAAQPRK